MVERSGSGSGSGSGRGRGRGPGLGATDGNRSRERMRHEVVHLRETVADLEEQLAQLRTQQTPPQSSGASRYTPAVAIANAAWQDMAERQRRLRYEVEIENSKLRSNLEDQIRLGKTLEKLLHRRQHAEVESMLARRLDTHSLPGKATPSLLDHVHIVQDLKASLASQLADLHTVFTSDCFAQHAEVGAFRHIDLRYRDDVGTFVEISERRIYPFDELMLSHAVMQQFDKLSPRITAAQDSWTKQEYTEFDVTMMIDTARFRGAARTKLLLQRVVVHGHIFFLYAAITDPGESLGTSCCGLYVRHRAWSRLTALPKSEETPDSATATEYVTYNIVTPEVDDVVPDHKRKVGTLINYVLATTNFQVDIGRESMDNYLLANANTTSRSHVSSTVRVP